MSTTILTIIGITIAAAAALMTVFYGGDVFFGGRTNAEAARLVVEASQVERAEGYFRAQEARAPGQGDSDSAFEELKAKRFLAEVPTGARSPWVIDYPNRVIRSDLGPVDDPHAREVCQAARKQLDLPSPNNVYRCDGSDYPGGVLPSNEPCCVFSE